MTVGDVESVGLGEKLAAGFSRGVMCGTSFRVRLCDLCVHTEGTGMRCDAMRVDEGEDECEESKGDVVCVSGVWCAQ